MKSKISINSTVSQSKRLVASNIDGEVVIMSTRQGKYYGMQAVGSRIWELIGQPITVSAVCDALMKEYKIDHLTCEQEVLEFLSALAEEKLIQVVDEPDP